MHPGRGRGLRASVNVFQIIAWSSAISPAAATTLNHMFPGRWIGRGGTRHCIARSPDFNPLDFFFFWGLMRSLVYKTTIEPPPKDLVTRIFAAAGEIAEDQAMIRKTVTENMVVRARAYITEEGRQFEPKL
ncbi:hypothetical protein WDU94_011177 [Cyamophila willieti]